MHQASHAIARRWVAQNAAILDTETTGLDEQAEIVEIAVVACSGETLLQTLVKPTRPIPAEVTEIHGITDAMVADAPSWPEVQARLMQILEGRQLVIWHADYDLRLIEQSAAAHSIEAPELYAECAQSVYKHFWQEPGEDPGSVRRQRLTKAAAQQGVEITGQEHRAEVDCLTTRGVILAMASGTGARWRPLIIRPPMIVKCKECGADDLTWHTHNVNRSGAQEGRLRSNDIECQWFLGCNHCSETLATLSADQVAELLNSSRDDQEGADARRYRKLLHAGLRFMAGGVLHQTKAETDAAIDALPDPLAIGGIKVVIDETLPPGSWRISGQKRADQE